MKPQSQNLVTDSTINFGRYHAPFRSINPLDAEPIRGRKLPRQLKNFRLKEWQAFQFANERYFANIALFNAKVLALVQVKIYDRQSGKKYLYERKVLPWSFHAPENLLNSDMRYRAPGCYVQFQNRLENDFIDIQFDIEATRDIPALNGTIRGLFAEQDPLVVAIPFAKNHGMYSHKGLVPLEGSMTVGSSTTTFSKGNGFMLMDDHRGYYPWEMKWDWMTTAHHTEDGKLFGFNLTRNDSIDPDNYNENGFWLDGKLHALPAVSFEHINEDGGEVWLARDRQGKVNVRFKVEVEGNVDINALIIRSKYRGPFGTFSGYVESIDGVRVSVDNMFGMAEDFYLRC